MKLLFAQTYGVYICHFYQTWTTSSKFVQKSNKFYQQYKHFKGVDIKICHLNQNLATNEQNRYLTGGTVPDLTNSQSQSYKWSICNSATSSLHT